jgi:hypothetical protein
MIIASRDLPHFAPNANIANAGGGLSDAHTIGCASAHLTVGTRAPATNVAGLKQRTAERVAAGDLHCCAAHWHITNVLRVLIVTNASNLTRSREGCFYASA